MGVININVKSTAKADVLYDMAHSTYEFVNVMPNIKEIILLEETEDKRFSRAEWVLDVPLPIKLGKLSWIKEAKWADETMTCDICLDPHYRGVVKKIQGTWRFIPCDIGTEMKFDMDFKIKHPLVSRGVHDFFDTLMRNNLKNLLVAVKQKAECA